MLSLTIFLGKLIGLYCIIVALAMMAHKQSAVATVNALIRNPPLLQLVEVLGLGAWPRRGTWSQYLVGVALPVVITL